MAVVERRRRSPLTGTTAPAAHVTHVRAHVLICIRCSLSPFWLSTRGRRSTPLRGMPSGLPRDERRGRYGEVREEVRDLLSARYTFVVFAVSLIYSECRGKVLMASRTRQNMGANSAQSFTSDRSASVSLFVELFSFSFFMLLTRASQSSLLQISLCSSRWHLLGSCSSQCSIRISRVPGP